MTGILKSRPRRRWLRFSLWTLLVLVTVLGVWLGMKVNQTRRQKEAVAALTDLGATVYYRHQRSRKNPREYLTDQELDVPRWLRDLTGDDFFQRVAVLNVSFFGEATDADLVHLSALPHIEEINFMGRGHGVTDAGLAHLPRPDRLMQLHAGGTSIGDGFVKRLANASQLESVSLDGTRVTGDGLRSLVGLMNLRHLSLCDTQLGDAALGALPPMPALEHLLLFGTKITDAGLVHLSRHQSLTSVLLNRTAIGDAGLKHLAALPYLENLSLYGTKVRGPGLADIAPSLSGWLDVRNTPIDDDGLRYLKEAKRLRTLNLAGTAINGDGLIHLHGLSQLHVILLDRANISDDAIANLAKALPGLRILSVSERRPWGY